MAGNVVEWALKLRDRFSAPGNKVAKTIKSIRIASNSAADGIKKLGAKLDKLTLGKGLAFAGEQISSVAKKTEKWLQPVKKVTDGFEELGKALEPIAPIFGLIGTAAIGAGLAIAGGVVGGGLFTHSVIKAQAFREDIERALTVLLKSKNAADDAIRLAAHTGDIIGASRGEVAGQFVDLLAKGFDVKKVDTIVRSLADLSTVDPRADLSRLTRTIGQIASTGRLQGDELNELANAGLETGSVYDALGKQLGKSRIEVIKLKEAGKITSDQAIDAILGAISTQAGGLAAGEAAAKKSRESITGIMKRLGNIPENFLFSIGVNKELGTVKKSLTDLLDYFEVTGTGGAKLATALESTFGALIQGFFGFDFNQPGGLTASIDSMLDGVIKAKPEIQAFATDLREAFVSISEAAGFLVKNLDTIRGGVEAIGKVAEVVLRPFASTESITKRISEANSQSNGVMGLTKIAVPNLTEQGAGLGHSLTNGMASGVAGGVRKVNAAVADMAMASVVTAKMELDAHSPSRLYAKIGASIPQGIEVGVVANTNDARSAVADMLAPPDFSAAFAAGGAIGASGIALTVGDINVDARGATAADAQHISALCKEEVVKTLETFARQLGA